MARRAKTKPKTTAVYESLKRPTKLPPVPFSMGSRGSFIRKAWVGVRVLGKTHVESLYYDFVSGWVESCAVGLDEIDLDHFGRRPMYVDRVGVTKTHIQWLQTQALNSGATPDAIRLLKSVTKLTAKEEAEMADKLKKSKKSAEAKAAKPVGGGGKVSKGKRGNPEALERARAAAAARNAATHAQKLSVTVTKKDMAADDFKLRGGRLAKLAWIVENKPKTVGDAVGQVVKDEQGNEHKIDMGALRGMEKRGHVKIG